MLFPNGVSGPAIFQDAGPALRDTRAAPDTGRAAGHGALRDPAQERPAGREDVPGARARRTRRGIRRCITPAPRNGRPFRLRRSFHTNSARRPGSAAVGPGTGSPASFRKLRRERRGKSGRLRHPDGHTCRLVTRHAPAGRLLTDPRLSAGSELKRARVARPRAAPTTGGAGADPAGRAERCPIFVAGSSPPGWTWRGTAPAAPDSWASGSAWWPVRSRWTPGTGQPGPVSRRPGGAGRRPGRRPGRRTPGHGSRRRAVAEDGEPADPYWLGAFRSGRAGAPFGRGRRSTPGPGGPCPAERRLRGRPAGHRPGDPGGRYFSAPAVSPCTTWRWKTMYAPSTGSMAITRPAKRPDQSPL